MSNAITTPASKRTRAAQALHVDPIYVDEPTAAAMFTLSEATVQRMVREGEFPKPRRISKGRAGYLVDELRAWARDRPVSDLLPPANTGGRKNRAAGAA